MRLEAFWALLTIIGGLWRDFPVFLCKNHAVEEASWEREDEMKSNYPELFFNEDMYNFSLNFF